MTIELSGCGLIVKSCGFFFVLVLCLWQIYWLQVILRIPWSWSQSCFEAGGASWLQPGFLCIEAPACQFKYPSLQAGTLKSTGLCTAPSFPGHKELQNQSYCQDFLKFPMQLRVPSPLWKIYCNAVGWVNLEKGKYPPSLSLTLLPQQDRRKNRMRKLMSQAKTGRPLRS